MRSFTLALDRDHFAASISFKRAANARRHAKLSPWTAERELESAAFWTRSGHHHKEMAAYNSGRPVRTWSFPTWREECEFLLSGNGSPTGASATLAGVE